jgi:hypothetical protein
MIYEIGEKYWVQNPLPRPLGTDARPMTGAYEFKGVVRDAQGVGSAMLFKGIGDLRYHSLDRAGADRIFSPPTPPPVVLGDVWLGKGSGREYRIEALRANVFVTYSYEDSDSKTVYGATDWDDWHRVYTRAALK